MPYNLKEFNWDSESKTLTAEESELTEGGRKHLELEKLYHDAMDLGIRIRNPHTGETKRFLLDNDESDENMMVFTPLDVVNKVKRVYIFND